MVARNMLLTAVPYDVEEALRRLGTNLRQARLRRNLTIAAVAEKIGTGPRAIADAEKGKGSTSIAVYAALLWTYGLLSQIAPVADAANDEEGRILAASSERLRARHPADDLDSDF
jgi:transcriptional regulator with XRE-family HTH domain